MQQLDLTRDAFWAAGQASPEDQLTAANYPLSGSYVDVSNYTLAMCLIHMGAIHGSDTPTFEVKQSDANNGTLDTLSATYAKITLGGSDDDEMCAIVIDPKRLEADHHFLSCVVSGVTNGSYGDILWLLLGPRERPVTQTLLANIVRYI